ncbi:hypothetical protein LY76DRAFT_681172 [Colletotrichum caudatum]|nr:hypothetical protein LY76DRAFT_681172 [Colletotrichum caudatum]
MAEYLTRIRSSTSIFTDFYRYVAGLIQAGGRLIRLGRRKEVTVHFLKVKDSCYDYMERIMVTKWAQELMGSSNIAPWIQGWMRYACVFEIIMNF